MWLVCALWYPHDTSPVTLPGCGKRIRVRIQEEPGEWLQPV